GQLQPDTGKVAVEQQQAFERGNCGLVITEFRRCFGVAQRQIDVFRVLQQLLKELVGLALQLAVCLGELSTEGRIRAAVSGVRGGRSEKRGQSLGSGGRWNDRRRQDGDAG